jgi:hypothetical protein
LIWGFWFAVAVLLGMDFWFIWTLVWGGDNDE